MPLGWPKNPLTKDFDHFEAGKTVSWFVWIRTYLQIVPLKPRAGLRGFGTKKPVWQKEQTRQFF
jgi:hypothetical protein